MKVSPWKPSEEVRKQANTTRFISFVNKDMVLRLSRTMSYMTGQLRSSLTFEQLCGSLPQSKLLTSMTR
jgi:hypothetical protein